MGDIVLLLIAAGGFCLVGWMLYVVGSTADQTVMPDGDGWVRLTMPPVVCGTAIAGMITMVVVIVVLSFCVFMLPSPTSLLMAAILVTIVIISIKSLYEVFIVRVSYNDEQIRYRGFFKTILVSWDEVKGITSRGIIKIDKGFLIINRYVRGYNQFMEKLHQQLESRSA